MINGNCQQAVSNQINPGDTSPIPEDRMGCVSACDMMYPYSSCSSWSCNCNCCQQYHWQQYNSQGVLEWHSTCSCHACYSMWGACIASCASGGTGMAKWGSRGMGQASPGDYRQGGRLPKRKRR